MSDTPVVPTPIQPTTDPTDNNVSPLVKLLSGKFILTVVAAICFYMITNSVADVLISKAKDITVAEIVSILSSLLVVVSNVFTFYFVRKSMSKEGQANGNSDDNGNGG